MGKHLKTPVSIRLSDDELALLEEMAGRYGTKAAAILAGLRALQGQNAITPQDAINALCIELGLEPPPKRARKRG
jgi:NADH:ubiquinone oxidoreductase subunit E